jgi:hypothetical protein
VFKTWGESCNFLNVFSKKSAIFIKMQKTRSCQFVVPKPTKPEITTLPLRQMYRRRKASTCAARKGTTFDLKKSSDDLTGLQVRSHHLLSEIRHHAE